MCEFRPRPTLALPSTLFRSSVPPAFVHRITKYDPTDRDEHGYRGVEEAVSDHGSVEAAYLEAISAFAEAAGIDRLEIREPSPRCSANARRATRCPPDTSVPKPTEPGGSARWLSALSSSHLLWDRLHRRQVD